MSAIASTATHSATISCTRGTSSSPRQRPRFLDQDPFDDHMAEMLDDRIVEQREKIVKGEEGPFIEPCPEQISGFEVAWAHLTESGVLWGVSLRRGENKK